MMLSIQLLVFLLLFLLLFSPSLAAEWSKFKTCSSLGFCRRHRHFSLSPSLSYQLLPDSLEIASWQSSPALIAHISSAAPHLPDLQLAVLHLGDAIFRVVVDEKTRSRDRNIVTDALDSSVKPLSLEKAVLLVDKDFATLTVPGLTVDVVMTFQPFAVKMVERETKVSLVELFSERRLLVEDEKKKPTPEPTPDPTPQTSEDTAKESGDAGENEKSEEEHTNDDVHDGLEDDEYDYDPGDLDDEEQGNQVEEGTNRNVEESSDGGCDGCFDEKFQSHNDPKLRGPEAVGADISFPFATHIYGIPERTVKFSLQDTVDIHGNASSEPYRLYNLDVFQFELDKPLGLYGAIPFIMARKEKDTVGMLWLNSAETYVDVRAHGDKLGKKTHWYSETGLIDVFLIHGPKASNVFQKYIGLTGPPAMPQRFALGYHQCRWNYRDEEDSKAVDKGFDDRDIPYDVLWLDIEHTDGKRYFTWDNTKFPDPTGLQNHIAARGRKMVTIIDPHIKRDNKYQLHKTATEKNYYVLKPDGKPFDGWCWPGSSSYFDFTSARVRQAWADHFNPKDYPHFTEHLYTWNDMNEPSVFNGPEGTMQKDLLHEGNVEHRHVHNIYGHYFMQATFEGLLKGHGGNDRPFVLSRSFFAGSQRYGAIWTGDNTADWDHLESTVRMLLPLQISGMVFAGADVGGFFGNPEPDLLTRWYQAAAFQPFFRGHAHLDTNRREPWLAGEPYTAYISKAIRTRYEYMPFWYTLFAGNALGRKGGFEESYAGPPMRPVWWEFPEDGNTDADQRQWMVGKALLVAPVLEKDVTTHEIYVPPGDIWYDLYHPAGYGMPLKSTGDVKLATELSRMVVFQRGGTIVPKMERRRRSTAAMAKDPFTLIIALDESRMASGELYLDDGKSYDHEKGVFTLRRFTFQDNMLSVKTIKGGDKDFIGSEAVIERLVILGYGSKAPGTAMIDDRTVNTVLAPKTGVLTVQRLQASAAKGEWILKLS